MNCLGVDPGLKGGWAVITADRKGSRAYPMPVAGGRMDLSKLSHDWRDCSISVACVEKVGAMPGQGVTSMFTFGMGFGAILGVLAALNVRVELVTPQAWKKAVLAGTAKDKDAAIAYCRRAFPDINLVPVGCRVPHDGCADAICLAEYGARAYR